MLCTHPTRRPQRHPAPYTLLNKPLGTPRVLLPDEQVLTAPSGVHGWRYEPADVDYERKTLMLGGPLLFLLTGIASAIGNRTARKAAEAAAAPQWRPLGPLTVLATTDRLLIWHQDAWWSVWYSAVMRVTCDREHLQLQLPDAAPYLLAGDVEGLAGAIEVACRGRDTLI